jgi:hypothetical protein
MDQFRCQFYESELGIIITQNLIIGTKSFINVGIVFVPFKPNCFFPISVRYINYFVCFRQNFVNISKMKIRPKTFPGSNPAGSGFFRSSYIAVLLPKINMFCHCVWHLYLRKMIAS